MADEEVRKKSILDAFSRILSEGDGTVDSATLMRVLKGIDGEKWTEARVATLMDGAGGGKDGRIRVDYLINWLFGNEAQGGGEKSEENDTGRFSRGYDPWASAPAVGGADEGDDVEPCSPKVPTRKKKREKRAKAYVPDKGEKLYCPESHLSGMLLIREYGTFSYVHDGDAKFSEGVQGEWDQKGDNLVKLKPKSFGYCYEESFDPSEILGLCPVVTLCPDRADESGTPLCTLPPELLKVFSWMDPTKEEGPTRLADEPEEELEEPTSPKVPQRKKDKGFGAVAEPAEVRSKVYVPQPGEQLYRPKSNRAGLLLLRPNGMFSYVHDSIAKMSEGVQGQWQEQETGKVRLEPKSLGWCYDGVYDLEEMANACYTLTLCPDDLDSRGRCSCTFPDEIANHQTWLHPTLDPTPRSGTKGSISGGSGEEVEPTSPKIPSRKRRNPEKRANAYQLGDGEEIFSPESRPEGVLLLRNGGTFAYVHDSSARFSEGVQGSCNRSAQNAQGDYTVTLLPDSFGWCYQESFDDNEIVGIPQTVTIRRSQGGPPVCILSDHCLTYLSWLDPSLPDANPVDA